MAEGAGRLPFFKEPRDLTQLTSATSFLSLAPSATPATPPSSRPKRIYKPNIPPKRDRSKSKNKDDSTPSSAEKKEPEPPPSSSSSPSRGKDSSGGGRGRGRGRGRNLIQTQSIFQEGVGSDPDSIQSPRSSPSGRGRGDYSNSRPSSFSRTSLQSIIQRDQEEKRTFADSKGRSGFKTKKQLKHVLRLHKIPQPSRSSKKEEYIKLYEELMRKKKRISDIKKKSDRSEARIGGFSSDEPQVPRPSTSSSERSSGSTDSIQSLSYAELKAMTDNDLFQLCLQLYGKDKVGPVTVSTRTAYENIVIAKNIKKGSNATNGEAHQGPTANGTETDDVEEEEEEESEVDESNIYSNNDELAEQAIVNYTERSRRSASRSTVVVSDMSNGVSENVIRRRSAQRESPGVSYHSRSEPLLTHPATTREENVKMILMLSLFLLLLFTLLASLISYKEHLNKPSTTHEAAEVEKFLKSVLES